MLNKHLMLSLLGISFITMTALVADSYNGRYIAQNTTNTANYDAQIDQAVSQAEAEVKKQYDNATRRDVVPMWSDKVQLETAIRQLELKKTLAANFKGTQSLNNPAIRAKLLEMLNKSMILQNDLAELQNLVIQEKMRLNAQPAPTPTPASSPNVQVPTPLVP